MDVRLLKRYRREAADIFWVESVNNDSTVSISVHYKDIPFLIVKGERIFIKKTCENSPEKVKDLLNEMLNICTNLQRNYIIRCVKIRRFLKNKWNTKK